MVIFYYNPFSVGWSKIPVFTPVFLLFYGKDVNVFITTDVLVSYYARVEKQTVLFISVVVRHRNGCVLFGGR